MGAEGGLYFSICDTEENIERIKKLVNELRDEPPTQL